MPPLSENKALDAAVRPVEALAGGVGGKDHKDEEGDGAQERHQHQKEQPAAEVAVMQPANRQSNGRDDGGQAPNSEQDGTDRASRT